MRMRCTVRQGAATPPLEIPFTANRPLCYFRVQLYMEQTAAYIVEALSPMSRNSYSWDEDASPPLTPSMHVLKQTLDFEMQNMGCGGGYAMMLRNAVVMSMQAKLAFIEQVVPQ